ncbi:MAG: GNAT family N-acetyltransferase [Ferruginibacter sp.]
MNGKIYIRPLNKKDIPGIVAVHLSAFSGFFLTTLGPAFLRKYYSAVIGHKDGICIGCENSDGLIIGFAVGTRLSKGFHRNILCRHWITFFQEGVRLLVTKPGAIVRLAKNLNKNNSGADDGLYAELLSIGVSDTTEGKGVGRSLIKQFEVAAIESGAKRICLTTDKFDNEKIIGFYLKNGYEVYCDFITYPHRSMYKMIKNIV